MLTLAELLSGRHWSGFLRRLPVGTTDWRVENYRDFISLRTTASILSKKSSRKYSIRQDKKDTSVYNITVEEVTL
jgi:hypothetical protein